MITVKDHSTGRLFDPWAYLGPKRRKLLENSWAGVFRTYLLEKLPVSKVAKHFNDWTGRPTKELHTAIGVVLLQQLHDLSDPEVTRAMAFNLDWQYALDIIDESDAGSYLSERTLRNYRRIIIDANLEKVLFNELTDTLIAAFDVDTSKQRLDSTIIRSNMRKYGRILICATTIRKFLKKLRRTHKKLYDSLITAEIIERYMAKNSENIFSRVKPSGTSKTLQDVGNDLLYLIECFRPYETVCALPEYQLLERVLSEQFTVTGSGPDATVTSRPPKEVPSDSLQNPSDPDAAYDSHKGSGYQAQIMETYHETKDKKKPNLITYVDVEPANIHDSHALQPAIDAVSERGCTPDELVCDTLYGSDDNVQQAVPKHVKVIAPVQSTGSSGETALCDFTFDPDTNFATRCPEGHEPVRVRRTKKLSIIASFDREVCGVCPRRTSCPIYLGKRAASLYYTDTEARNAQRRAFEQTTTFKDRYRWRAGIEGTNSHLKNDVGADRLRVRGLVAVRFAVTLKALGLNILRCAEALSAAPRALITTLFGLKSSNTAFVCSLYDKILTFVSIDARQLKCAS